MNYLWGSQGNLSIFLDPLCLRPRRGPVPPFHFDAPSLVLLPPSLRSAWRPTGSHPPVCNFTQDSFVFIVALIRFQPVSQGVAESSEKTGCLAPSNLGSLEYLHPSDLRAFLSLCVTPALRINQRFLGLMRNLRCFYASGATILGISRDFLWH